MPRLTEQEFFEHVLPMVLDHLELRWSDDWAEQLQIAERTWQTTEGDWKSIAYLALKLRRALTARGGHTRELTPDILREVFGAWEELS